MYKIVMALAFVWATALAVDAAAEQRGEVGESCRARNDCADGLKCVDQICVDAERAVRKSDTAAPELTHPDDVRVRGGVSGGAGFLYAAGYVQPTFNVAGRVGVQLNHLFSVYYQNMLTLTTYTDGSGGALQDYNAILANFTAAHVVDFGVGPSLDVFRDFGSSTPTTAVNGGAHVRLGVRVGSLSWDSARRRGVLVGLDMHPTIGGGGVLFTMFGSAGYEWF